MAEFQSIYEPHGVFLNAHPYAFSAAQVATYKAAPFTVGTDVRYPCSEIDVTGVLDPSSMSDADLVKLGVAFAPNPGGPVIRVFFFGDFASNATVPPPSGLILALAMNRSYVGGMGKVSAADRQKLMFSLMCAGRAGGSAAQHPYVVAHEMGHLLMDKCDTLTKAGLPVPVHHNRHHFNPPAAAGYPGKQNLMWPFAANAVGIDQPKRICDVEDADGYNQLADLRANVQRLQIPELLPR